jgi:hypothetical protein
VSLPGPVYLDASALLKLYLPEEGSAELDRALRGRTDLLVADLAVTEIASALSRRAREGSFPSGRARKVHDELLRGLQVGPYERVELAGEVHRAAERLLFGRLDLALRAADALHLALATASRAESLATFDTRLHLAARAQGLVTHPASL